MENQEVANCHDYKGSTNQANGDEHGVGQTRGSVPYTLVVLLVKIVSSPSDEVRKLKKEGRYPTYNTHDNAGDTVKQFIIELVVAKVYIA